jgi:hypothetical protein
MVVVLRTSDTKIIHIYAMKACGYSIEGEGRRPPSQTQPKATVEYCKGVLKVKGKFTEVYVLWGP